MGGFQLHGSSCIGRNGHTVADLIAGVTDSYIEPIVEANSQAKPAAARFRSVYRSPLSRRFYKTVIEPPKNQAADQSIEESVDRDQDDLPDAMGRVIAGIEG